MPYRGEVARRRHGRSAAGTETRGDSGELRPLYLRVPVREVVEGRATTSEREKERDLYCPEDIQRDNALRDASGDSEADRSSPSFSAPSFRPGPWRFFALPSPSRSSLLLLLAFFSPCSSLLSLPRWLRASSPLLFAPTFADIEIIPQNMHIDVCTHKFLAG